MNTLRTALTAAASLALVAVPLSASATATETPDPAFLAAEEMPPSYTPWTADPVADGLPEYGVPCAPDVFPSDGTRHRTFRTELDTGAEQITTVAATESEAAELLGTLRRALAGCGDYTEREYPYLDAESRFHGKVRAEEGAYVYSLDLAYPEVGATDIHLLSVGRDGRTVTLVQWGQMGDLKDAPLKDFKATTRTAVNKLYR
ncbi:hypothetical protein ACX6XY_21625 [Streptomyces sp. O3]